MVNSSSPSTIQDASVFMFICESPSWPMFLLAVVFLAEAAILVARFPIVVQFLSDLAHRRRARVQLSLCRNMVIALMILLLGVGILAVFLYLDYAEEKCSLGAEPGIEEWRVELTMKNMFNEYAKAVAIPGALGICGLGLWLCMYCYCLAKRTNQ